jgi:LPPG:FO 2-phospho-L-lactate transferase
MIVALAGGVGGAKLAHGLYGVLGPDELTVVVNTADDFDLYGLHICPDADTVLYTLAGIANAETGWGVAGDTFTTLEMLRRYGEDTWFALGDRDFATHILRTARLRAGESPTRVLGDLAQTLGVRAALLPMCDEPVATVVQTPQGELAFQDYFVRRHHQDAVVGVRFAGIEQALVSAPVRDAMQHADAVVFCPSNPIVSVGPILGVPSMRELLRSATVPRVAVSPIVGGKALRGPADRMLAGLGYDVSPLGVATLYRDVISGLVIDRADQAYASQIESLGPRVLVTETVMTDVGARRRLANEVLSFAAGLRVQSAEAL